MCIMNDTEEDLLFAYYFFFTSVYAKIDNKMYKIVHN